MGHVFDDLCEMKTSRKNIDMVCDLLHHVRGSVENTIK